MTRSPERSRARQFAAACALALAAASGAAQADDAYPCLLYTSRCV